MPTVFLGLGTNLGDRRANLRSAIAALAEMGTVGALSRLYETKPQYVCDQPAFLNMAARMETSLAPLDLLGRLKALEDRLGRVASVRYGPRLIDLDILFYDGLVLDMGDHLTIPHPRLHERRFALAPLADVAGGMSHPVLGTSVAGLLADLPDDDDDVVVLDGDLNGD